MTSRFRPGGEEYRALQRRVLERRRLALPGLRAAGAARGALS